MNAIVTTEQPPRLPSLQSGGHVRAIVPQDFEGAWRIASAVCKAGMAPYGLETPEKAMVAIMHGLEVGLTPMAALQSIAVVNGRPTIFGDGAIGLVRGSGKMEWIKERIEGTGDNMVAICEVKRKGEPDVIKATFSVADAKLAKLWMKKGNKGQDTPWVTHPKRMLTMRARAFALRDGFADVLRGLGITEEVQDIPVQHHAAPLPPMPPMPPAPPGEVIEHQQEATADVVDADTGEILDEGEQAAEDEAATEETATDFFDRLEDALSLAKDAAEIEEIWTEFDALAHFEGKPNAEVDQGIATAIRRRHTKRVGAGT
jgi:hypothetical protein